MSGTSRSSRPLQASLQRPDAESLARLVALAPEGSRITLSSGVYHCRRPLTISRALHLVGHPDGDTVILGATAHEPLFRIIQGGSLTTSSLTLARPADDGRSSLHDEPAAPPGESTGECPPPPPAALISVEGGECHCHRCELVGAWTCGYGRRASSSPSSRTLRGHGGAGVARPDEWTDVPVERRPGVSLESPLVGAARRGVGFWVSAGTVGLREVTAAGWAVAAQVNGRGKLAAAACCWRDNERGVVAGDDGVVLLTRGELLSHDVAAVTVMGAARASLSQCGLRGSVVGLFCGDESKVEVVECLFEEHVEVALRAGGEAQLSAHESRFVGDAVGLNVRGEALVKVFQNLFEGSTACGVRVEGAGCGRVSDNVIRAAQDGVCVLERAQPELVQNHIVRSRGVGVRYEGHASGFARDNLCEHNGTGVVVGQDAAPLLRDNRLWSNGHHGVLLKERARATLRGNHCLSNGRHGVLFRHESAGDVVDNLIEGSVVGVRVSDRAGPTLRSNRCLKHSRAGFCFEGSAGSFVEDNMVGECDVGVHVLERARPTLIDNRLLNNAACAIEYSGTGTGLVRGNTCRGSAVGVRVHPGAGPVLFNNHFGDNERDLLLPPLTSSSSSVAPVSFAAVPAQTPRRLQRGGLDFLSLRTLVMTSSVVVAATLSVFGDGLVAWLAGWAGLMALPVAGATTWKVWRRRALAVSGQRVEAHVLESDPETGQVIVSFSVEGRPRVSRLNVPVPVARVHPRGITVPAVVAAQGRVAAALFPTLEGVRYVTDVVAEDTRVALNSNQAPGHFEPLSETFTCELWSRRADSVARHKGDAHVSAPRHRGRWRRRREGSVGALICSPEFIEQRGPDALAAREVPSTVKGSVRGAVANRGVEGSRESPGSALRVSWGAPFAVQLTVWPRSSREADLCVTLRQIGEQLSRPALCFAVTLPQQDLDRGIPVMQRDAPMLRPEDFPVIWRAICAGARVHGEDLSGSVRVLASSDFQG